MTGKGVRLVAVSNRLPISLFKTKGHWEVQPGSGGLVTAMAPVLRNRGGVWIGWPGVSHDAEYAIPIEKASLKAGYMLSPVSLTEKDIEAFYYGFSNEIIWPLFHDIFTRCNFVPEYWESYLSVNKCYAEAIVENSSPDDYIWVHDYHLMNVSEILKQIGGLRKTGFFLHIPFPPADLFLKLPWRAQILKALLEYDLVGFQTQRDKRNFLACLKTLFRGIEIRGKGPVVSVEYHDKCLRAGNFPISIDFREFEDRAKTIDMEATRWNMRNTHQNKMIMLGVDRLDYTKGIPERLQAFKRALLKHKELHGRITLVQLVVPSREEVPEYQILKREIEQLVGQINGEFTFPGWIPIHYVYGSISRDDLVAFYTSSDIALVTPLIDGMNLVGKEYCACNIKNDGVLILSEFAGAAAQLKTGALLVNPHDIEGVADAIYEASIMDKDEKRERMKRLRKNVRKNDIFKWVDSFLEGAFAKKLKDFPHLSEYSERIEIFAP